MIDKEYMDADAEVISMCNKCHKDGPGPGGELPTFVIPAPDTAPEAVNAEPSAVPFPEESAALDERIQNVRNALPLILVSAFTLFTFIIITSI
ncbi:MAG: hypothetical protein IJN44_10555 [Clostridia bacterium]|nr:hypothetical protein [Clostridia bacterium]